MLVVVSDSHRETGTGLDGRTLAAVREANVVAHAGDFVTADALDAFQDAASRLYAVCGNADRPAVRERLPTARSFVYEGATVAMTHRQQGGAMGLELFGRERDADVVVSGHTHRPRVTRTETLTLLNPGSHADPRGNRRGHAELERVADGLDGRLVSPDGTVAETFHVPAADIGDVDDS
ncbi:metallophosphoesterase [Halorubellus sp. JP-L1]|uniref:metallophosphoesterase n=1 Tax=Halorubellus sp. JP-L1 TaxID=2715753 RepID=UPI00140932CC|nr:metallophosphoesterase [Halorubellus sp. JP-L1]NHN41736.1 metallophosphoesterase [Halorubellus sp. JP-L1]